MRQKKGKKRILITTLILVLVLIIGNISIKYNKIRRNVVEAIRVVDTLEIIKSNHPITIVLNEQIKFIQEEKAKAIIVEKVKLIKEKKAEEERIVEVNRLISENEERNTAKKNMKMAYLTFDDGPSVLVTPKILKILEEYNIKATFFVVGNMVDKNPQIFKSIFDAGHSIGNHSYSHNYGYIYKNTKNFMADINRAEEAMKNVLGDDFKTNLLRFPGGSFGKDPSFIKVVETANYKYFDWNSLNGDAEGFNLSKERLFNRLKEMVKNKNNLIILMHDIDTKTATADSLGKIIDYLINEGYYFDVLDNFDK